MLKALTTYLHDSVEELKLVRWPTRQQAIKLSAIVVVFILVCSVIFGLIDLLLSQLVKFLFSFVL